MMPTQSGESAVSAPHTWRIQQGAAGIKVARALRNSLDRCAAQVLHQQNKQYSGPYQNCTSDKSVHCFSGKKEVGPRKERAGYPFVSVAARPRPRHRELRSPPHKAVAPEVEPKRHDDVER